MRPKNNYLKKSRKVKPIIKEPCSNCRGKGTVREEKTINIKVPAGVEDGNRLRIAGEGDAGDKGAPSGNLYVEINIQKHLDFQRDGANLYYEKQISFVQASLGDSVDIPTISGEVELKIPPGTQSGTVFRLRNQGMPIMQREMKGNGSEAIMMQFTFTPIILILKMKS